MNRSYSTVLTWVVVALLLAGCGVPATPLQLTPKATTPSATTPRPNEEPEYQWAQLLSRDAIRPIYEPESVPAGEAGYADDELVMGVAIEGEARAYPVGLLNRREMVNDELAGIPILVTW